MPRISKENYYLDIAQTVLERATCLRRVYGAIIVKNDEIISIARNEETDEDETAESQENTESQETAAAESQEPQEESAAQTAAEPGDGETATA